MIALVRAVKRRRAVGDLRTTWVRTACARLPALRAASLSALSLGSSGACRLGRAMLRSSIAVQLARIAVRLGGSEQTVAGSIAFVDESGDLGRRPGRGSSHAFVLALVVFAERAEADACRERIDALRAELGRAPGHEFHFHGDSRAVQRAFVRAVSREQFRYYTAAFVKPTSGGPESNTLLSAAFGRLFSATSAQLAGGVVSVDGSADRVARRLFETTLRQQFATTGERAIRPRLRRSETDNLLQLADYIAGIARKRIEERFVAEDLHRLLQPRCGGEYQL